MVITPCGKDDCALPASFVVSPANDPDSMNYHCCVADLAEGVRVMIDQDPQGIVLVCLEEE